MSIGMRNKGLACLCTLFWCFLLTAPYLRVREESGERGGLRISEVCVHNRTVAYDSNGKYDTPYVEFYNAGEESLPLYGYGFSDDAEELYKYVFPDVDLLPGETLLLWAKENEDVVGCYREDYIPPVLGFSIEDGDTLYLCDDGGAILQTLPLPKTDEDEAYACFADDMGVYVKTAASPGETLTAKEAKKRRKTPTLPAPVFSRESGFYDEAFPLRITCGTGEVYYTLDGSEPDENASRLPAGAEIMVRDRSSRDNIYASLDGISVLDNERAWTPDEPVDKATLVKAVAIDGRGERSEVVYGIYFIGFAQKEGYEGISVLSMTVDPDDFFSAERGIYVAGGVYANYVDKYALLPDEWYAVEANYMGEGRGWERPAQFLLFDESRAPVWRQKLGVRLHGNYSVSYNQKGFNLYARSAYDGNRRITADFFGKRERTLTLRNGDAYTTKMVDVLNHTLVADREVSPQSSFPCALFLNGEYWGLYNMQERVGESYIEAHYGLPPENTIVMKNGEVICGTTEDSALYEDMVAFAEKNDLSLPENYAHMEALLDVQSYIEYFCTEIYIANKDAFGNNFACFRARKRTQENGYGDGRWRFMLYDTDDTYGKHGTGYVEDTFTEGNYHDVNPTEDVLFSSLMRNEEFKRRFFQTFYEMADTDFAYERAHAVLEKLRALYEAPVVKSGQRFIESYTADDFEEEADRIDEFLKRRREYILPYMEAAFP